MQSCKVDRKMLLFINIYFVGTFTGQTARPILTHNSSNYTSSLSNENLISLVFIVSYSEESI